MTDPDRFDNDDLLEREAAMGRSNFMLQFMLDTSLADSEKFPLKMADLVVTSVNPTTAPDAVVWCSDPSKRHQRRSHCRTTWRLFLLSNAVTRRLESLHRDNLLIDPSGRGTDETAAAYLSQRNGFLYLHEMRSYKDGYSDNTFWTF